MGRDILSGFGPDSPANQKPRATSGGVMMSDKKGVNAYAPPQGPIGISRTGVGLGGANLGCCGTQGPSGARGDGASGSPGLHGKDRGMGTNRKG